MYKYNYIIHRNILHTASPTVITLSYITSFENLFLYDASIKISRNVLSKLFKKKMIINFLNYMMMTFYIVS